MKNFNYLKFSSYTAAVMALFLLSGMQQAAAVICPPDDPPPCIESSDITDGTITAADIATGTVTGGDIATGTIGDADLGPGAVRGPKIADGTITDPDFASGAVRGRVILDGTITDADLAPGAVRGQNIANGTITGANVAPGAIGGSNIASLGVGAGNIANGAITLPKLGSGAVTSTAIADGTITSADLGPSAVGNSQLQANISLGKPGDDGDIVLRNVDQGITLTLDGQTGLATQPLSGNGLVKAWALLDVDGTLIGCFRCNAANTFRAGVGDYRVDFTPLGTDIRFRPRSATLDNHNSSFKVGGEISISVVAGSGSQLIVDTADSDGSAADKPFTVLVY